MSVIASEAKQSSRTREVPAVLDCFVAAARLLAMTNSNREAGAAAARGGGVRVRHLERRADQYHGAVAADLDVVFGLGAFDVEFVLKARAAAALDAHAQHGAGRLAFE